MEPFVIKRLAYDGCDPSDTWIVTGIGHSKMNMENVHMVEVSTISEYENGCQLHPDQNCSGHMCKTPYGRILPMQSLAVSTGIVVNDVAKAARTAFESPSRYHETKYKDILKDSMKKKTGRMRKGVLNCHIDGSLRMVITPQDDYDFFWIAVPRYIADKWTVVYFDENESRYRVRHVKEGDYAIVVRPPVLSIKSLQCLRIRYWDQPCMGISPYILSAFSGDYDGDEMHVYPVYSDAAVQECKDWICSVNATFEKAFREFNEINPDSREDNPFDYMEYTTLSFEQIASGHTQPPMAEYARTRKEHLDGFRKRYDTSQVLDKFVAESIRGMGDTNAQQISQPIVGDMSRLVKMAAGCVIQRSDGTIGVATRDGFDPVSTHTPDEQSGNPTMRSISYMCAGIQQSALESHHAKEALVEGHDLMSDMMVGEEYTLVILDKSLSESKIRRSTKCKQLTPKGEDTYVLCKPSGLTSIPKKYIKASYNPIVLSMIDEKLRLGVCRTMIDKIARFYNVGITSNEIECIAVLFSYRTDASKFPITTRDGNIARNLRWTETCMATYYSKLIEMVEESPIGNVPVETISARLMSGNLFGV